jgi:hypothetical protein
MTQKKIKVHGCLSCAGNKAKKLLKSESAHRISRYCLNIGESGHSGDVCFHLKGTASISSTCEHQT